ncbi:hypothetical protein [Kineococcus sp. R86509]|uniref:hypothetical protein n=1 Tax=Kineococcus sp. R86509 TaxID=3093851 RepID=UPI0036D42A32
MTAKFASGRDQGRAVCKIGSVIWLLPLVLTVGLSIWVGTRLARVNAPGKMPIFSGAFRRPPGYAWTQALLLVMAMVTAYTREKGLSQTHATSWVFGVLAAYVPFLLVILLHNVRSAGRPRNDR